MSTTDNGESNPNRNELEQEGSYGPFLPSPTTQSCEESGIVKKRGEYKKRSKAWDHFHVKHVNGVRHAICKYCEKDIAADPRSHIDCIRAAVRYVRQSPSRLKKFKECVEIEKIECKRLLCLDVSTRWNSTYLMLDTAQRFERAFERFEEQDPYMLQELENLPTKSDWTKARFLVIFLENFYQLTVKVSGSKYVISNNFFTDISHIHGILIEMTASDNEELSSMARSMKEKYDKYWGKIEKMNMLIFISSMLDPRTKLEYLEFVVCQMYGESDGTTIAGLAKNAMFELFNEYKMVNTPASNSVSRASSLSSESQRSKATFYGHGNASKTITDRYKLEFKKKKMELGVRDAKFELEKYLNENCEEDDERFDILLWWKANSLRFPILSKVACDMLAVPISTVASEYGFSTGGRVLNTFRSSLTPRIVQSLICAQDWFRSSKTELNVEENLEELETFESELLKTRTESTIIYL
ncbi:zinc finger BED domain-containing protein RICESLEEPER 2-like [Coffea arabica]|uniref:Zinc finger BED domain-containing protein RICESLEEPER 2-like n=1 Tax=Coffea arabica TaxID=13443 RepID=A0ABM4WMC0_COFAR